MGEGEWWGEGRSKNEPARACVITSQENVMSESVRMRVARCVKQHSNTTTTTTEYVRFGYVPSFPSCSACRTLPSSVVANAQ